MGAFLRILGFAVAGFVAAYLLSVILALLLLPPAGSGDSGGREMGIFFVIGPLSGIVGTVVAILFGLGRRRKPSSPPAP